MKRDSLVARRAAESISLSDLQRTYDPNEELSLGGEIDDDDRLSLGSACCGAPVYVDGRGAKYCSKCGEHTTELYETEDEYLDRIAKEEEEQEELKGLIDDAFDAEEEGGY